MDDNKIIELYFMRDEDAITQTKEFYGERLKVLAYCILRSSEDAEECENLHKSRSIFVLILPKYAEIPL